jgi:hypothetical protein
MADEVALLKENHRLHARGQRWLQLGERLLDLLGQDEAVEARCLSTDRITPIVPFTLASPRIG